MKRLTTITSGLALAAALLPTVTFAAPPEKNDFICPVFNSDAAVGDKNPNAVKIGGGDYTIIGPNVSVPNGATNDDGAGSPDFDHATPGDPTYTAIWSG